jgi:sugar phosphate isomerase/epimerase
VERLFRDLAEIGIRGLRIDHQASDQAPSWVNYAKTIAACAHTFGFAISAHAPATDISATDPAARATAVATVQQLIHDLGSHVPGVVVTVHPENYAPQRRPGDDEARMQSCHLSLETLAGTASAVGAHIALENMRRRPDAPNRTGMLVDQLTAIVAGLDPSTVGLCFDTGHANISEQDDLADVFGRNAARILHVHLQDNLGADDLHLRPGQGNIDFSTLLGAMSSSGYDGMVELEVKVPEGEDPYAFCSRNYQYFQDVTHSQDT